MANSEPKFHIEEIKSENTEEQIARTELREKFLRILNFFSNKDCEFLTCEKTKVTGTFHISNPLFTEILVKNLTTPFNLNAPIAKARLRTADLISIKTIVEDVPNK